MESRAGTLQMTASIGIAFGDDGEALLKEADIAMYRAKGHPDIGYAFFDAQLDRAAVERSERIAELREGSRAPSSGSTTRLSSTSTATRSPATRHSSAGNIPLSASSRRASSSHSQRTPASSSASVSGCSPKPAGKQCASTACTAAPIQMSVNVSACQLHHPEFLRHIEHALSSSALMPKLLTLELTESTLLSSNERVCETLQEIKDLGVVLALDDFGTGYASLSYLRQFPIDVVKIDRSFTANADSQGGDLVLLKGIIDLGHALQLNLVAEGIETSEQHSIVRKLGCHQAQGFYFGRPSHPAQQQLNPPIV